MMVNRFDFNPQQGFGGVGQHLLDTGTESLDALWLLDHFLAGSNDKTVVDVGANIGTFALPGSQMVSNGKLYAFEPQRQIFQMMCGNMALNSIDNVFAERLAIGMINGPITIPKINYYHPSSFGSIGLTGEFCDDVGQDLDFGNGEIIRQTRLDDYFGTQRIDFLKIDVEGMEQDVLEGARKIIARDRPMMYIEFYKQHNQAADLKQLISDLGYVTTQIDINFACVPIELKDEPRFQFLEQVKDGRI